MNMNSSYYNINITLRYTNSNFIIGVVAVPDLRAMLGVVKCPLREAIEVRPEEVGSVVSSVM